MRVAIEQVSKEEIHRLISLSSPTALTVEQNATLDRCVAMTVTMWVGCADGKLVCIWGLIPPTLLSDQAYLWLYTTDEVKEHEFMFVRRSKLAVEEMLEEYPTIVGVVQASTERSVRWIKWLGAEFGESDGKLIPFVIRKKVVGG